MSEPSRSTSRHVIAGATLAVIAVAAAGFALGRSTAEPSAPPSPPAARPTPTPSPTPAPVLPTLQPPLGRADLLAAAASAADALAAGQTLPADVAALAGREFELALPFGCPELPQSEGALLSARYDAEDEALRVRAEPVGWVPTQWLPADPATPDAAPAFEAIQGFWIARPWLSGDACPATPAPLSASAPAKPAATPAPAPPGSEQTLGIAVFFPPESSRVGRRDEGEAYEAVARVAPDALDLSQGLRLRLRGRLAARPAPLLCRAATASARPVCLISANLDEVAVLNPATGVTLATWDVASKDARSTR